MVTGRISIRSEERGGGHRFVAAALLVVLVPSVGCRTRLYELPERPATIDCPGLQPGSPWPMFGRCARHDNRSHYVASTSAHLRWSGAFGSGQGPASAPSIAADGTVYVTGCALPGVVAVEGVTGRQKWAF